MARRRKKHEDHANHEAWAIPYGDLITLLLAFFVVMYAISSVNEGKYRILSDSLVAAFRGTPRTVEPVQVGAKQVGSGADLKMSIVAQQTLAGQPRQMLEAVPIADERPHFNVLRGGSKQGQRLPDAAAAEAERLLGQVADDVERAMKDLVDGKQVIVRRLADRVEVEIRTDILFDSASATPSKHAQSIIERLAEALAPFPNAVRVEGHTDNVPIRTRAYPSNWELSAARAATVVHILGSGGVAPERLAVLGYAEFRPVESNATALGRNMNRRVLLVVTGAPGSSPIAGTR
ncbi:MAG: Motility protein B [Steroidobacteraceae bacterium]|nr:Motility protein B [Steroidobacteraceae bacterium]